MFPKFSILTTSTQERKVLICKYLANIEKYRPVINFVNEHIEAIRGKYFVNFVKKFSSSFFFTQPASACSKLTLETLE